MPKITGLTPPKTRRQLQSFFGVLGYYAAHIPNLSKIADPLHRLLGQNVKFRWGSEEQAAFEQLKHLLAQRYPLAQPRTDLPFHLYSDASQVGMGCVLLQEDKVVGYYAKRFGPTQRRYPPFEQEALAVVLALKHYRYLLLGGHTILWTDHKPLIPWFRKPMAPDLPLRQAKWLVAIQDIDVEVRYIPGTHNHFADLLSRPHMGPVAQPHVSIAKVPQIPSSHSNTSRTSEMNSYSLAEFDPLSSQAYKIGFSDA